MAIPGEAKAPSYFREIPPPSCAVIPHPTCDMCVCMGKRVQQKTVKGLKNVWGIPGTLAHTNTHDLSSIFQFIVVNSALPTRNVGQGQVHDGVVAVGLGRRDQVGRTSEIWRGHI